MKIMCTQSGLMSGIRKVQKALSGKTTLPILEGILIQVKEKKMKLIATDLDISIETYVEAVIQEEGSAVVNARLFGEIVSRLNGQVEITTLPDENKMTIISGKSKFDLVCQSSDEYPELPVVEGQKTVSIEQSTLKDMINQTFFAAAKDETRPILTGIKFDLINGELYMVALDAYRLALSKRSIKDSSDMSAIIPAKHLAEVSKILGTSSMAYITMNTNHVAVSMEGTKINIRLLEGEYINYKQIIPSNYKIKIKVKTMDLAESIDRIALLSDNKANIVRCEVIGNTMELSSKSTTASGIEEVQIVHEEGEDLKIAFNAAYFTDVLKTIDAEYITIEFTNRVSPIIIKKVDSDENIYMVLPIRINDKD